MPRSSNKVSPNTNSATERVFEKGALNTGIPKDCAALISTWFVPIQKQPIATNFLAWLSTFSLRFVRERMPIK